MGFYYISIQISCPIVKLVLRNNALTTLRGIENLKEVEGIDLSYNIISNFFELEILSTLPSLKNLWLEGNPICCARWYRAHVYSFFHQPNEVFSDILCVYSCNIILKICKEFSLFNFTKLESKTTHRN